jgi:hypothetical protein
MNERSKSRVAFHVKASIKSGDSTVEGDVDNLSMNGMFIRCSEKITPGLVSSITIYLSGASSELTLNLVGKVVRGDENGLAVNFLEMDLDTYIHLKNIIAFNQIDNIKIVREFEEARINTSFSD